MPKIKFPIAVILLLNLIFPQIVFANENSLPLLYDNFVTQITLITVIFISIFAEIKTAGFSGAGLVAVVVGFLMFFIQGSNIQYFFDIVLFFIGLFILFCDLLIFFTGFVSIAGIICICMSLYINLGANIIALNKLFFGILFAIIAAFLILRKASKSFVWNKISQKATFQGYKSSSLNLEMYINKEGKTITVLRPTGKIKVGQVILDAVSEGEFIDKNEKIKVLHVVGSQVVVCKGVK